MAAPLIGRAVRRLQTEQALIQQGLAVRLGIPASYLNLIEHEQLPVTAALLIKLAETLKVDLASLSESHERQLEAGLRGGGLFFFLRVDPAGNFSKRFSAAGFPFARFGGSCPRWVVCGAFAQPGQIHVQVA